MRIGSGESKMLTVVVKREIHCNATQFFPANQFTVNFFSKYLVYLTKFLWKNCFSKIPKFPQCDSVTSTHFAIDLTEILQVLNLQFFLENEDLLKC